MAAFNELKLKKQFRYIVYKLSANNKEIVVEKKGESTDYEDFIGDLPEKECRFAVYDVPYEVEGGSRNKLVFYTWYVLTHSACVAL
jgi:cofilin